MNTTQVSSGIAGYNPQYVTMDYAAQYVRALYTSNIASSIYDPNTGNLQTVLSGKADMAMAGGTEPGKLAGALASVQAWVAAKL